MSTAVAYRAPSDPDAHHSSASPHSLQNISSSARPNSSHNPSSPMSSSPPRPQTTLAPRPSVEVVRANPIQNAPSTAPATTQSETRSPQGSKTSQSSRQEGPDDVQSSQIPVPSVEVKQERPATPEPANKSETGSTTRHRPRKLDLSNSGPVPPDRPSAPITAKDSAPLTAMQDIGLACLSPGFQTEDPRMTQQLQRSMDLREEQRRIIEARLQKGGKDGESSGSKETGPGSQINTFSKPPGTSRRKGPPPGLSITAPSAQQFASEPRVIQSAPLNQTFTGLHKPGAHPLSRQVLQNSHAQHHDPPERRTSASGATSSGQPQYATYSPAQQSANRLPPIQDVFANENLGSSPYRPTHALHRTNSGPGASNNTNGNSSSKNGGQLYAPVNAGGNNSSRSPNGTQYAAALPSPAYPPQQSAGLQPPTSSRGREFKSAEEAVHAMSGGRDEMLPKVVHYGGHQPPTPPSPLPPAGASYSSQGHGERQYGANAVKGDEGQNRSMSGRRRTRDEYERDFNEREAAEADRMDIDLDRQRERGRHAAPAGRRATDSGIPSSGTNARNSGGGEPGLGFGFGALGSEVGTRHSPETIRRKKEEFLALCSRAWDLLHE